LNCGNITTVLSVFAWLKRICSCHSVVCGERLLNERHGRHSPPSGLFGKRLRHKLRLQCSDFGNDGCFTHVNFGVFITLTDYFSYEMTVAVNNWSKSNNVDA